MDAITAALAEAKRQNAITDDAGEVTTLEGLVSEIRRKAREEGRMYAEKDRAEREAGERVDSAERELRREYQLEIDAIAERIAIDLRSGESDDAADAIHEAVDGHSWVIYTHSNFKVLLNSSNHDACTDEMGEAPQDNGGALNWAALALYAMSADVRERLSNLDTEPGECPECGRDITYTDTKEPEPCPCLDESAEHEQAVRERREYE